MKKLLLLIGAAIALSGRAMISSGWRVAELNGAPALYHDGKPMPPMMFWQWQLQEKIGRDYAVSTDTDIFLYDVASGTTRNLCKPTDYKAPAIDYTKTLATQSVNKTSQDLNLGYDVNPQFSPDGTFVAWHSTERDGYESDRNRLCIYTLADGKKKYVTEAFDSNVDDYCWTADSRNIYFIGVWHGCENMYRTDLNGNSTATLSRLQTIGQTSVLFRCSVTRREASSLPVILSLLLMTSTS